MADITQVISTVPDGGHRGVDLREAFVVKTEAFRDHLKDTFVTEVNTWKDQVNTLRTELNTNKDTAVSSATAAAASAAVAVGAANYKGDWVAGYNTTGYSIGESVSYTDGFNYISKVDTNLVEPTTLTNTADWDWIEAIDPTTVYTKTESDTNFEPKDATILKDADIGVNVEAYDATILKSADIGGTVKAEPNYVVKTTTYTAVANDYIYANTSGGVFTITLPITPSTNDIVTILDSNSSFVANNLTVARNGSTIMGLAEDIVMDLDNMEVKFIYTGSDWRVSI